MMTVRHRLPRVLGSAVQGFPVSLNLSKPCQCCLCNSKSSDASPFHVAQEDDQYGGAQPWNKYRKVRDPETDSQVRVPEGKVCLICFSTFRGLGYHYKYGSYNAYYQQIRDNAAAHSEFLASVKEFISQKNDNPKMRIDKAALKQAGTTLHSETKSGVRFEGPEMEFVMLEHWDPKLDGQLDETKVVEETWKGKKVKGVWSCTFSWLEWMGTPSFVFKTAVSIPSSQPLEGFWVVALGQGLAPVVSF